jgi:hypothetical protein
MFATRGTHSFAGLVSKKYLKQGLLRAESLTFYPM